MLLTDGARANRAMPRWVDMWVEKCNSRAMKHAFTNSACYSVPSNSVIESVMIPEILALRTDNLSWATEHAGSAKPTHCPPAPSQRSLQSAQSLLQ